MIEQQFEKILRGEMSDADIGAFLLELKSKGETPEDIANAARALLKAAKPFPRPQYLFADLVGTGGDESGTLNISTAAALLVASMGLPVAKHGNKSVSSKCGSADVLTSLGANLEMTPEQSRACLDETRFCFLLAPVYHPGMKHAAAARKALHTRTIFNLLGPLVNPARPPIQLTGVYDPKLCKPMAETFGKLGSERVLVVHGSGLDEIAIHGPTQVAFLHDGVVEEHVWQPRKQYPLSAIAGGEPAENALALERILQGNGTDAQNEAVAVNAGALVWLSSLRSALALKQSIKPGLLRGCARSDETLRALETLKSGKAYDTLHAFIEYSRKQAA